MQHALGIRNSVRHLRFFLQLFSKIGGLQRFVGHKANTVATKYVKCGNPRSSREIWLNRKIGAETKWLPMIRSNSVYLCEVVALRRDDNISLVIKSLPAIKYEKQ